MKINSKVINDVYHLTIPEHNFDLIRVLIKKIPAGVAIFDREIRYIAVSDRWFKESKIPKHNIIGKLHYDLVKDIPDKWRKIHQRALQGEYMRSDGDVYNRKDGTTEWVRWECFPWFTENGVIGGIAIFFEHTTEHRLIKKEMEKTIQILNKANVELGRFAYMCAHDLSEPLRTISNYIQLIEQAGLDKLTEETKGYLNSILLNARYMHILVADILRYAEINTQKIKKKNISLQEIIITIKTIFEKVFQEKSVIFQCDMLPVVKADEVLLTRVFQNLISNALKFNVNHPPVINIKIREINSGWLIAVEDNGIGIHPNYHDQIFDLFERLHAKSKYDGSGIGLSLCKKIIDAHSGRIWVHSIPNQGSTFFFTLPQN